ncbi:unnamed protein product [Arctia plantaginis]|uniref:FLYWCH-type domain-containing protein n=1 Tax=Arctia plantaginis TaxID=874455 RepID=A0A8S0ZTI1_ARCPL|nr:unnamed protein product [Arctia plantaginis]
MSIKWNKIQNILKLGHFITGDPYETPYMKMLSQKGRELIVVGGYTFSKKSNYWVCSSRMNNCKAMLRLNAEEKIIFLNNNHTHKPRDLMTTPCGKIIRL